jgi:hypothetical protein
VIPFVAKVKGWTILDKNKVSFLTQFLLNEHNFTFKQAPRSPDNLVSEGTVVWMSYPKFRCCQQGTLRSGASKRWLDREGSSPHEWMEALINSFMKHSAGLPLCHPPCEDMAFFPSGGFSNSLPCWKQRPAFTKQPYFDLGLPSPRTVRNYL